MRMRGTRYHHAKVLQQCLNVLRRIQNAQDVHKWSEVIPINVQCVHNATTCSSMIKYAEVARSMLKYDQVR